MCILDDHLLGKDEVDFKILFLKEAVMIESSVKSYRDKKGSILNIFPQFDV